MLSAMRGCCLSSMGRKCFGIRVPSHSFARAFAAMRPNDKVPVQVATTVLCKVGPFPAEASVDSVQAWASFVTWSILALRVIVSRSMFAVVGDCRCHLLLRAEYWGTQCHLIPFWVPAEPIAHFGSAVGLDMFVSHG